MTMRNERWLLLGLLLAGFCTQSFNFERPVGYRASFDLVVLDAGHGGKDPGALGKITREKHICLAIAQKVAKHLKATEGIDVVLTRDEDRFIELKRRAEIANEKKADLFVSIHVNSSTSSRPAGTSTYALGMHKAEHNLSVVRENSVILTEENHEANYEGFDPKSPEGYIIFSLIQNVHLKQSLSLASLVEKKFKSLGRYSRGVHQAGFLVLWRASMPAVLIETGFISNATEEKYLSSPEGQEAIAAAIYQAILDYKKAQE